MLTEWLEAHETILWGLGALSMMTFVGSLIVIPLLIVRIPTDYFIRDQSHPFDLRTRFSVLRLLGRVLKNVLGFICILMGLAMLVLPGQGVLTILLGIMLMNFPGKRALERRLVQQPNVLKVINWVRARAKRPPLRVTPLAVPAKDAQEDAKQRFKNCHG